MMFDAWQEQLNVARIAGLPLPRMPRDVAADIVASVPKNKAARRAFVKVARLALDRQRLSPEAAEVYRSAIAQFEGAE